MIGFVRGILAEKGDGYITVDVNGIGYIINVPANSRAYLKAEGSEVMVYTAMTVREDDVSLYGFSRKGELEAFHKLVTVNGIGAKAAISILSSMTLEQLTEAIAFEDAKALTKAQGVGKKTAERIVLELKDKFRLAEGDVPAEVQAEGGKAAPGGKGEAVEALIALGYSRTEAMSALAGISGKETAEDYIKAALKNLI